MASYPRRPSARAFFDVRQTRKFDHAVLYCRQYLRVSQSVASNMAELAMLRRWEALATRIAASPPFQGAFHVVGGVKKHVDALKKIVA